MKVFRVAKPLTPNVLIDALTVAEVPLWSSSCGCSWAVREDTAAMYGVVRTLDAAVDQTVRDVIDSHVATGTPSRIPTPEEIEAALIRMEKV